MFNQRGPLMVAAAASIWGSWSLFLRPAEAIAPLSPFTETLLVQVAASCVAVPMALAKRPPQRRSWRAWATLGLSGVSDTVSGVLFFFAMSVTSLAVATLTHYLAPLLVALAAPLLERRPHTGRVLAATVAALAGLTLMLAPWQQDTATGRGLGAAAGAASAVFYALIVLFSKNAGASFNSWELLAWQRVVAVLVMLPLAVATGDLAHLHSTQLLLLGAGGALINGLAGMLFFAGLQRCRAEQAAALTLLEPLGATCVGWAVWHEQLSLAGGSGILLVLGSLYVVLGGRSS